MKFKTVINLLKKYDFENKINISHNYSRFFMNKILTNNLEDITYNYNDMMLPWEIEAFATISLLNQNDWPNNLFSNNGQGYFEDENLIKIKSCLRNYNPESLEKCEGVEFKNLFLIAYGAMQFKIQENYLYKIFRYNYFFNFENEKISVKKIFHNKYGCDYFDFFRLFAQLRIVFCIKDISDQKLYSKLLNINKSAFENLVINKDEFVEKQKIEIEKEEDYILCFKWLSQFPFIEYNEIIHCPAPHLLIDAITSSLLYRLTEDNNDLRNEIGKEVNEQYIYDLCELNTNFNEIKKEITYGKTANKSPDVLARKDKNSLLIETKLMVPKSALRKLKKETIENTINRISEYAVKLYLEMKNKYNILYIPFEKASRDPKDIFGLIILMDDGFIPRDEVYKIAADKLAIKDNSDEMEYLCSHIKIISLFEFERNIFKNEDIIKELIKNSKDSTRKYYNHISPLNTTTQYHEKIKEIQNKEIEFIEEIKGIIK